MKKTLKLRSRMTSVGKFARPISALHFLFVEKELKNAIVRLFKFQIPKFFNMNWLSNSPLMENLEIFTDKRRDNVPALLVRKL